MVNYSELLVKMKTVKVVLVTGGGGYIGSHCVLSLLNAGYQVVALDNFSNCQRGGSNNNVPASLVKVQDMTGKQVPFYEADLTNIESLRTPFAKVSQSLQNILFAAFLAFSSAFQTCTFLANSIEYIP